MKSALFSQFLFSQLKCHLKSGYRLLILGFAFLCSHMVLADERLEAYLAGEQVEALKPAIPHASVKLPRPRHAIPSELADDYIRLMASVDALLAKETITKQDFLLLEPQFLEFRQRHTKVLERLNSDKSKLESAGLHASYINRQSAEIARYLDLSADFIIAFEGLMRWANSESNQGFFTDLWLALTRYYYQLRLNFSLDDLASAVERSREKPILHAQNSLPYQRSHWQSRSPNADTQITPSYLQDTIAASTQSDLSSTNFTPLSTIIIEQAKALEHDPIRIYEFVRNDIDVSWYIGAAKNAEAVLAQRSGNDVDQASLLIALLRASSIPARYVHGVIRLPVAYFQSHTGIENPNDIADFLRQAGYAHEIVVRGGRVAEVLLEYTWVSALLPYANYRGATIDRRGQVWLPLAPAFKQYEGDFSSNLIAEFELDQHAIRQSVLNGTSTENPVSLIKQQLELLLSENNQSPKISDYLNQRTVQAEHLRYLPNSLPFKVEWVSSEASTLADNMQQTLRFEMFDEHANTVFDLHVPVAALEGKRVTLSYIPASVDDQNVINAFAGMSNVPAYLVNLRPQIKVNGELLQVAYGALPMGVSHRLKMTLNSPAGAYTFSKTLLSGSYHALAVTAHAHAAPLDLSEEIVGDTEHLGAKLLAQIAARYSQSWMQQEEILAQLNGIVLVRPLPALVFASNGYETHNILDVVYHLDWRSLTLDAIFKRVSPIVRNNQEQQAAPALKEWMASAGLEGSYWEHKQFENDFGVTAISADRGLALAAQGGDVVHQVNFSNSGIIATLNHAQNVREHVSALVNQGMDVFIPQNPISLADWSGSVWMALDSQTGESAWLISGGLAGGETSQNNWPDSSIQKALAFLWDGVADSDEILGSIDVLGSTWRKGKPEEEVIVQVRATSLSGKPMSDVEFSYAIYDGGGELKNLHLTTDDSGLASFTYVFGTSLNEGETFFEAPAFNEPHAIKSALSYVSIKASHEGRHAHVQNGMIFQLYADVAESITADYTSTSMTLFNENGEPYLVDQFGHLSGRIHGVVKDSFGNPVSNSTVTIELIPGIVGNSYAYNGRTFADGYMVNFNQDPGLANILLSQNRQSTDETWIDSGTLTEKGWNPGGLVDRKSCPLKNYLLPSCKQLIVTVKTNQDGSYYADHVWASSAFEVSFRVTEQATGKQKNSESFYIGANNYHLYSQLVAESALINGEFRSLAMLPNSTLENQLNLYVEMASPVFVTPQDNLNLSYLSNHSTAEHTTADTLSHVDSYIPLSVLEFNPTVENANITYTHPEPGRIQLTIESGDVLGPITGASYAAAFQWQSVDSLVSANGNLCDPSVSQCILGGPKTYTDSVDYWPLTIPVWVVQPEISTPVTTLTDGTQIEGLAFDASGQLKGEAVAQVAINPAEFQASSSYVELYADNTATHRTVLPEGVFTYKFPLDFVLDAEKSYSLRYFVNNQNVYSQQIPVPVTQDIFISPANNKEFRSTKLVDITHEWVCGSKRDIHFELSHKSRVSVMLTDEEGTETIIMDDELLEKGSHAVDTADVANGSYLIIATSTMDNHVETRTGTLKRRDIIIDDLPVSHTLVADVDIFSGSLNLGKTDLELGGRGPGIRFGRSYNSNSDSTGVLGKGWNHNFSMKLVAMGCGAYRVAGGLGSALFSAESVTYEENGEHIEAITNFKAWKGYHGELKQQGNRWVYYTVDGTQYHFKHYGFDSPNQSWHLEYIKDPFGNTVALHYLAGEKLTEPYLWDNSLISKVVDSNGRTLSFEYERLATGTDMPRLSFAPGDTFKHQRLKRVTAPEGYVISFEYDNELNLAAVNNQGAIESYSYFYADLDDPAIYSDGRYQKDAKLISATNARGFTTTYSYTTQPFNLEHDNEEVRVNTPMVNTVTQPIGEVSFSYEGLLDFDFKKSHTVVNNAKGIEVVYHMDFRGLVIHQSVPDITTEWDLEHVKVKSTTLKNGAGNQDLVTEYTYDAHGNVLTETLNNTYVTQYEYAAPESPYFIKNRVSKKSDAQGNITQHRYSDKGALELTEYPEGLSEQFSYNDFGDLTRKVDRAGKKTDYRYDKFGFPETERPEECCDKTFEYNALGHLLSEKDGRNRTTSYSYNARGHLVARTLPVGSPEIYEVDVLGNRISETDFRGFTKTWAYNELNLPTTLTEELGTQTVSRSISYDAHGNKITETDWNGTETTYSYNNHDHLIALFTDGTPAINISYQRDASGKVTQETQGDHITSYSYNALHNILVETDAEAGQVVSTYDLNGNVLTRTDRNGHTTSFEYDGLNRVVRKVLPNSFGTYTYAYDGYGNIKTETRPDNATFQRIWSQHGQLKSEILSHGNFSRKLERSYDEAGHLALETNSRGESTTYQNNDYLGRPQAIVRPSPLSTISFSYDDDAPYKITETYQGANGNRITRTYDARGQLIEEADDLGILKTYARDANGNVLEETDANGNTITRSFTAINTVKTETGKAGLLSTNTWDEFGNLLNSIVHDSLAGSNLVTSYTYNKRNNRLTENDSAGTTSYAYDNEGNVTKFTDKNGHVTTTTYDALNYPNSIQEPIGALRNIEYDALGRLLAETDRNAIVTTYTYDALGNQTGKRRANVLLLTQVFDGEGNLITSTDANNNITTYDYYPNNILKALRAPENAVTQFGIDPQGNVTSEIDPVGRQTTRTFDERGRKLSETKPQNRTSYFTYDGNGNLLTKTLPEGNHWAYTYDSLDNILSITAPENTGLNYSYDQRGNKLNYTDAANQSTTYQYDAHNRLTQITYPDARTHSFSSYDGNHNLLAESDPSGSTRTYTYDGLNREVTKTINAASGFEESITQVTTAYDGNGNKLQVSETGTHGGTATYQYDNFDRLIKQTDQHNKTIQYAYDLNGNRISLNSNFHQVAYEYDKLNRLKKVVSDGTTQYHYFQDSQLKSIQYPSGITAHYLYNASGFLQSIYNTQSSADISSVEYSYDNNGNRTQQLHSNGTANINYSYEYDAADRLIQEKRTVPNDDETISSFTYDNNSNRSTEIQTTNATQSKNLAYTYNQNNQLTTITNNLDATQNISYSYDNNGNRITKTKNNQNTDYVYNAEDQLVRVEENSNTLASFVYDHQGLRIQKQGERGTEVYTYDDQSVLFQTNESGALQAKYTYGSTQLISITEPSQQPQFYLFDGLGSPITLTQANGQVTARYSYDAFGNRIQHAGNSFNAFGFTGHEHDNETGLVYMKARFYDPDTGQFLTEDNFGGFPDMPPSLNKYLYAYANPIIYVDPDGNVVETAWDAANIVWGAKSFYDNYQEGNYVSAAVDAAGVVLDTAAAVTPFIPGGAAAAIKAGRAADKGVDALKTAEKARDLKKVENSSDAKIVKESPSKPGVELTDKVVKKGDGSKSSGKLGREGEEAASVITGVEKNTQKFTVNGRTRIPDQVNASNVSTRDPLHLTEVKNVKSQSLTKQLKDDVDLVGGVGGGGRVDVFVRKNTKVSAPLQKAHDNPLNPINIRRELQRLGDD